jgi:hypothetical protein
MQPIILLGKIIEGEITTTENIENLAKMISDGQVIIIKEVYDKNILNSVKTEIFDFGQNNPESNPKREAKIVNFHRIDNNHPLMSVKRIAHFFRYSYHDQEATSIFKLIHPLNILRNSIAGLNKDYTFYSHNEGFLSQPAALHYPVGGGYMSAHVDPVDPQKVEMVLSLSERGVDFQEGGLSIFIDNKWQDVEKFVSFGDICMFRPDIPHRVNPIDPNIKLNWCNNAGRWTIFSPIANISDESKNEAEVKDLY